MPDATKKIRPSAATAIEVGALNLAVAAGPSASSPGPAPAIVVTLAVATSTARMLSFPVSATRSRPRGASYVTPVGWRKRAARPCPSLNPGLAIAPANVTTVCEGSSKIARMQLFSVSATYTVPRASTATEVGWKNRARRAGQLS